MPGSLLHFMKESTRTAAGNHGIQIVFAVGDDCVDTGCGEDAGRTDF